MTKNHSENRLWINAGIVLTGDASSIDRILKEIDKSDLKLVFKKVSLNRLWIKESEGGENDE